MITQEEMDDIAQEAVYLRRKHRRSSLTEPIHDESQFKQLRFWLNIIFLAAATVGMVLWFTNYRTLSTYVLIGAIIPKFIEVTLRILKL